MASRYNIFRDFHETKQTILEDTLGLYSSLNIELINSLEKYFKGGSWANNSVEKAIWFRSNSGLSTEALAKSLGVNPNSLRSTISRLNTRLKDLLFNGERLSSVCLSTDINLLTKTKGYIEFLSLNLDIYNELSLSIIHEINKTPLPDNVDYSEVDIFNALAFIAMHCKTVVSYQLSNLNIHALEKVLEELSRGTATNELGWLLNLISNYKKPFNIKSETIDKIKAGK